MLEKNFDTAVIGGNYLSFLFGIEQLELKQKILILDDPRLSFGDLYRHGLGPLEYHFLKTWGEERDIPPLKNIDRYFVPRPLHIFFNDQWIQLASRPSQNMLELLRRFGELFGDDAPSLGQSLLTEDQRQNFDDGIQILAKFLGQSAFHYPTVENFHLDFFVTQCPSFLEKAFNAFARTLREKGLNGRNPGPLLALLGRAFFIKNLSPNMAPHEIFHLFINFLGPSYSLQQEELEKDLGQYFRDRGGHLKKTQVHQWKFHRGSPWCLELASFEGIIHPRKIVFVGGRPQGMPFKLNDRPLSYQGLILESSLPQKEACHLPQGNFIFGDQRRLGTTFPFWHFELLSPSGAGKNAPFKVHFLSKVGPGSKVEFLREQILSQIIDDLSKLFPTITPHLGPWKVRAGGEIYIQESRYKKKGHLPLGRKTPIFDYSAPSLKRRIKNVHYFGPYLESPLGPLSILMEMKEGHYYL